MSLQEETGTRTKLGTRGSSKGTESRGGTVNRGIEEAGKHEKEKDRF